MVGHTYQVPAPLPKGRPGEVIAASELGHDPKVDGAQRWTLIYHSTDVRGRDIAVSGALFIPSGSPPAGGWPVVSWGHGTTGMADRCAPSETANLSYNEYAQEAASFVRAGYAVVASDYPGLGTPGVATYLIGVDDGNAIVDAVIAARHLDPHLSTTWFAVGHSEGGQAVLFASRAAPSAPGLHLGATVSIAPASYMEDILPFVLSGNTSDLSSAVYSLIGLSTADPRVHPSDVLTPAGRRDLPLVLDTGCLDQTDQTFASAGAHTILAISGPEETKLSQELGRYDDPDHAATVGPVLIVQGEADNEVLAPVTAHVVANLKALGSDVTERTYPGLGHDGVVGPSICDQLHWLAIHGGRPDRGCRPYPTDLS